MAVVESRSFMIVRLREEKIWFIDRYRNNKTLLKLYQHDLEKDRELYQDIELYDEDKADKYRDKYYHTASNLAHIQSLISDDERWFVSIGLATAAIVLQSIFGIIL